MPTWARPPARPARCCWTWTRELGTITNLTLRYDPQHTPPEFALKAVSNALAVTKPYFLNHPAMAADWGEDYVIASCYNAMPLKGGIYTLVRLNLKKAAEMAGDDPERFLTRSCRRSANAGPRSSPAVRASSRGRALVRG